MEPQIHTSLPAEFLIRLQQLEQEYLASDDPIRKSGFGGGADRWRREREPILQAVYESGDLLDTCCSNGYLLENLMTWGKDRALEIVPFGIDQGTKLVELARSRFPEFPAHFHAANAWDWHAPRPHEYVYALCDSVPEDYLTEFVRRLLTPCVAPAGRLVLGAYGSRSRKQQPFDVELFLRSAGYRVSGTAWGGSPPVARFAWTDRATSTASKAEAES